MSAPFESISRSPGWLALLAGAWCASMADAAPTPPAEPTHRELWVPERSLAAALKTLPKAVLVTREQFETLLRDSAAPGETDPRKPPVPAVLRRATYTGTLGDQAALITAEFIVDGLDDRWSELPLSLDPRWLGSVTVDGVSALAASNDAATLVVKGVGRHVVRVDFAAPILQAAGTRTLNLHAPGTVEASLVLDIPESASVDCALPFTRSQGTATFALPAGREAFQVNWSDRQVPPLESSGVFQDSRILYALDAAQVRAELALTFDSALKNVPNALALPLVTGTEVLAVDGSELARWSLAGDRLMVEFLPGERRRADLRVQLAVAVPDDATALALPAPVADGMHRTSGAFSLLAHPALRVRRVTSGALTARDDSQAPADVAGRPDFAGTWVFPLLTEPPRVEIERLASRFTATLDTQVSLARDGIHVTRHLAFQPREGTVFSPAVDGLLVGETIESVRRADGSEIEWRATERGLVLHSPSGTRSGESLNIVVTTTLRPAGWDQLDAQPVALALTSARLPGAEKVSGYVAIDFDDSLRVTTPKTEGLEPRDPRQFAGRLPLNGRLAWFRLDAFQLDLAVARRPVEFDAALALDVLPLLNSLELEGQVTLAVVHGGLRELTVAFPAATAAAVRWDSPLIAEKSMTEDGRWTLKFHQEATGTPTLRFHASLPLEQASTADATERRFTVQAPFPSVATARRSTGTLVVEANSDTELSLTPEGLDDLDLRLAPAIDGYAPRHRLVAAYAWRGGAPSLAIDGVRHRAGELAATVVDALALDSVVSADGPARHQAVLSIRSAGAQFLDLALPGESRVLSVVIDGQAAKPIRGPGGALRLPLGAAQTRLQVIYETPAARMDDVTRATLPPLALDAAIPVLLTTWRLHLPEGFSYSDFETNLTASTPPPETPSLARAFAESPLVAALTTKRHTGRVLMEIERSTGIATGDFIAPLSDGQAMAGTPTDLGAELDIITSKEVLSPVVAKRNLVEKWKVADLEAAQARLREMVRVSEESGTDLVKIEVRSADAVEARDLANDVAEAYVARRKQLENERVQLAFRTLSETRKAQEQEVERARNRMLEIVEELGIVDLQAAAPFTRGTEATGGTEGVFMDAQRLTLEKQNQISDYKAQLEALEEKEGDELVRAAASMGLLDAKTVALYEQHLQDQRTAAQLENSGLGADHPDVATLRQSALAEHSHLTDAVRSLRENLRDQLTMTEKVVENLQAATAEAKSDAAFDRAKYAQYQEAKDRYGMAQEILHKMIDEQERARVVNVMPRQPATIHERAEVDGTRQGQRGSVLDVGSPSRLQRAAADDVVASKAESDALEGIAPAAKPDAGVVAGDSLASTGVTSAGVSGVNMAPSRPAMRAGLLPLEFSLPEGGRTFTFTGLYPPTALSFRAVTWERQVRQAWLWILAGALAFAALQRWFRRPVLTGVLGVLIGHAVPVLTGRSEDVPVVNALLTGWLVALGLTLVIAVARRASQLAPAKKGVACG